MTAKYERSRLEQGFTLSEDNFFSRWSKRKVEVREGRAVANEAVAEPVAAQGSFNPLPKPPPSLGEGAIALDGAAREAPTPASPPAQACAPPLPDIASLTRDSDFSPFMARGVDPQLKTSALKKLFTDPRYNVQDGLDIYIADYSQPDPIPPEMLRQMVQSKLLGLFDREEQEEKEAAEKAAAAALAAEQAPALDSLDREVADDSAPPVVTQSVLSEPEELAAILPGSTTTDHDDDHLNLQLQPDHAAGRQSAGGSTSA